MEDWIRVRRMTLHLVDLPLINRFRTAYGTTTTRRTVLVRLEDADGVVGWGEAPGADQPLYAPDTAESSWYALTKLLAPRVVGGEFAGPADLAAAWAPLQGYRCATHAVECAEEGDAVVLGAHPVVDGGEEVAMQIDETAHGGASRSRPRGGHASF